MSRNGSGTYSLPAGNPVVTGTTISSSWANNTMSDIASALTGSLASDGQTPMTGNLDANSNKIVNLADPTLVQDAATKNYTDTTFLAKASNLSDVANTTTARTNISAAKSGANSDITSLTGLTTPLSQAQGGTGTTTGYYGFKNRIINGAMVIDQRNAGASVTPTASVYALDRWKAVLTQASKFSFQQNAGSVTPPAGFTNYFGITSTSAYSVLSSDLFLIGQAIEGYNIADLGWGTANAKTITVSFWVRSSLTGTFGATITNSAGARFYPFTYTISSANTWEQKSVTIAGDTTGTWLTNNGIGIFLYFGLGVGSADSTTAGAWTSSAGYGVTGATSVVGTNGATFYITGVQLEVGSTATSFDYRPYGTELALCQRYAYTGLPAMVGYVNYLNGSYFDGLNGSHPVPMRANPTVTLVSNLSAGCSSALVTINAITGGDSGTLGLSLAGTFTVGQTSGRVVTTLPSLGGSLLVSAEL